MTHRAANNGWRISWFCLQLKESGIEVPYGWWKITYDSSSVRALLLSPSHITRQRQQNNFNCIGHVGIGTRKVDRCRPFSFFLMRVESQRQSDCRTTLNSFHCIFKDQTIYYKLFRKYVNVLLDFYKEYVTIVHGGGLAVQIWIAERLTFYPWNELKK